MTKRDALSVSLRIVGLVGLYRVVPSLVMVADRVVSVPQIKEGSAFYFYLAWTVLPPIVQLVASLLLIVGGGKVAVMLIRHDAQLAPMASVGSGKPIFVIALKVVGVVCIISGGARLAGIIAVAALTRSLPRLGVPHGTGVAVYSLFLIALTVYLLSGAKHLVAFAFRERQGPTTATE